MVKLINDKYYTPKPLARELFELTINVLLNNGVNNISDIIEPSAGNGAFSSQLICTAYDIEPESENIIKSDFLTENIDYLPNRLCIGNPPFGNSNSLSIKFYKKCCEIGDYIAFIQPISQLNNNIQLYHFDLIYSTDLGIVEFSNRKLHCCFNIYKRPSNGKINLKNDFTLKDITIKEYRRNGSYKKPENYDYAICNWGNGCLGKVPEFVGQYAQEAYFYCNNKKFLEQMKQLLEYNTIRKYVNSISAKRISVMRLYKYLKDNLNEIN